MAKKFNNVTKKTKSKKSATKKKACSKSKATNSNKSNKDYITRGARELHNNMCNNPKQNQVYVYKFRKKKFWLDFKVDDFKSYCKEYSDELGRSYDSLNNDWHAANIAKDAFFTETAIGRFHSSVLLQMKHLMKDKKILSKVIQHGCKELDIDPGEATSKHITGPNVRKWLKELVLENQESNSIETEKNQDASKESKQKPKTQELSDLSKKEHDFFKAVKKAKAKTLPARIDMVN